MLHETLKKFFRLTMAVLLMLSAQQVIAQTSPSIVIRGQVKDKKNEPIPGASVIEQDKDNRLINGTSTDVNGNYQIRISNANATLICRYIGSKPQTIKVNGRQVINITLEDENNMMQEVAITSKMKKPTVNTGFLDVDKRDMASSVSSVKMADLENLPAASIEDVLEGRVPGLMVTMSSGDPGAGAAIQLRGASSLGLNTKPLIVVDGIPWTDNIPDNGDLSSPQGLSNLLNISPTDIATVDILKDAAATALYGADGANGVIAITTKRGSNIRPTVSATSKLSLTQAPRMLPMLNGTQYKTMVLEAYQNRYNMTTTPTSLFLEPGNADYENYNNNTNWPKQLIKNGFQSDQNISIRGGGDATGYAISLGYLDEKGTTIRTGFRRANGRLAFDYKVSSKLKFLSDVAYTSSTRDQNIQLDNIGNTTKPSLLVVGIYKAPVIPVFAQDQYGNSTHEYFIQPTGFQGNVANPVAVANLASAKTQSDLLNSSVQAQFRPLNDPKTLYIQSVVSLQYENANFDTFLPHSATGKDYTRTNIQSGVNTAYSEPKYGLTLYQRNWATYSFNNDKNTFLIGGGTIYTENRARILNLKADNVASEFITDPYSSPAILQQESSNVFKRTISLTGQMVYIYGDRYSVQAVIRRDGSSAFGGSNRFGTFPSISGFWRPSSEPFMKKFTWLDDMKIRASWGITGRAPDISASNSATFSANAAYGDLQGVTPDNIDLANLKWERTEQANLGLDLSIFKNRLSITTDVYNNITRDLLWNRPIPNNSGFESVYQNFGSIQNRGIEFEITGIPLKTKDWMLTVSFNIYKNVSKVLSLPDGNEISKQNTIGNGQIIQRIRVGDPLGAFYGFKYKGVYARDEDAFVKNADGSFVTDLNGLKIPIRWNNKDGYAFQGGDAIYEDLNHDGVINLQDVTKIGNSSPDFAGGLNLNLTYKSFTLNTQFTYRYGNDVINVAKMNTTNMYNENNQTTAVMRRWRKQGDVTDIPRALYGAGYNWVGSDRYVEDGSFIRLSAISLGYRVPAKVVQRLRMKGLSFSLSASNLAIFTKYSGIDPEVGTSSNTDPFKVGQDNSLTPPASYYTFNTVISF
ncbi:MAG: SusC/RagA family TonB-linked outer membrane protein [Candidatus Pedobacter colombiensis]|uniref:SusC/RagA family TonB-linked outer membrane protein n=1 Tax=Candidatus Pedobacter colombiensis TaxID=3121371 RepID=A0AAJ5WC26_9SPHI|nr:SusC/RagA family TonB-linked outer membrane protein [Pedobacter sp.]WEK19962.1 MAG: SusC/RagA family TonB-linked outer membrane protein [Pedobacter sp.]